MECTIDWYAVWRMLVYKFRCDALVGFFGSEDDVA